MESHTSITPPAGTGFARPASPSPARGGFPSLPLVSTRGTFSAPQARAKRGSTLQSPFLSPRERKGASLARSMRGIPRMDLTSLAFRLTPAPRDPREYTTTRALRTGLIGRGVESAAEASESDTERREEPRNALGGFLDLTC